MTQTSAPRRSSCLTTSLFHSSFLLIFVIPLKSKEKPGKEIFTLKNRRIMPDDDDNDAGGKPAIIWQAHDHKFPYTARPGIDVNDGEAKEPEETDCVKHYKEKHGIELLYPNMPVVRYVLSSLKHSLIACLLLSTH
jgi:hypothetical protein